MMSEAGDLRVEDKFSYEAVLRRRTIDYRYSRFEAIMAAQREPGTVVGFDVASLDKVVHLSGFLGLRDTGRFIGDLVFGFFPEGAPRSYLANAAPFLFVPDSLGCDVSAVVREIERAIAGRSLQLTLARAVPFDVAAGIGRFDGGNADDAVIGALIDLNEDRYRRFPDSHPIFPEGGSWMPHFPPEYSS